MSNEAGNFVPQRFRRDNRNFFDDPLIGIEIKGRVVPENRKQSEVNLYKTQLQQIYLSLIQRLDTLNDITLT